MKKDPNKYPKGLDARKVKAIIDYHDRQSDDASAAEAEAAFVNSQISLVRVPSEMVDAVKALIAGSSDNAGRKHKARKRKVA